MFVCDDCHKADEKIIKCDNSKHGKNLYGGCNICNKFCELVWCGEYNYIVYPDLQKEG